MPQVEPLGILGIEGAHYYVRDLERSRRVLEYVHKVWRRPVILHTVDQQGSGLELKTS